MNPLTCFDPAVLPTRQGINISILLKISQMTNYIPIGYIQFVAVEFRKRLIIYMFYNNHTNIYVYFSFPSLLKFNL